MAIKSDIYIEGHVVANDKLGEKHKSIVIADNTGGIELKIDDEEINSYIPLFSHVELRCSGLHVGREGGKTVVGAPPTSEYVVDRITPDNIFNYLTIRDNDIALKSDKLTIDELNEYKMLRYVNIHNLQLVEEEAGKMWCERDQTTPNAYLTTIRHFCCEQDTLRIVTDGKCHYASENMPQHRCSMQGVVDWHDGDIALRITSHQITE